jgi:hypothetical protein
VYVPGTIKCVKYDASYKYVHKVVDVVYDGKISFRSDLGYVPFIRKPFIDFGIAIYFKCIVSLVVFPTIFVSCPGVPVGNTIPIKFIPLNMA